MLWARVLWVFVFYLPQFPTYYHVHNWTSDICFNCRSSMFNIAAMFRILLFAFLCRPLCKRLHQLKCGLWWKNQWVMMLSSLDRVVYFSLSLSHLLCLSSLSIDVGAIYINSIIKADFLQCLFLVCLYTKWFLCVVGISQLVWLGLASCFFFSVFCLR